VNDGENMSAGESVVVLTERINVILDEPIVPKRMFGGLTFMLNGNMLCCASSKGLMVRVGTAAESEALARPIAARCLGAGRPMAGFILVDHQGLTSDADLCAWVQMALDYVGKLPPKEPGRRKPKARSPKRPNSTI
jgi:hypothetical protein